MDSEMMLYLFIQKISRDTKLDNGKVEIVQCESTEKKLYILITHRDVAQNCALYIKEHIEHMLRNVGTIDYEIRIIQCETDKILDNVPEISLAGMTVLRWNERIIMNTSNHRITTLPPDTSVTF